MVYSFDRQWLEKDGTEFEKIMVCEIRGLSTETKPTDEDIIQGSMFLEMDTSKIYFYTGAAWTEFGA